MPPVVCYICNQAVYLPEQLKACDKIYHKMCFKCGKKDGDGCGRRMDLTEYVDKSGEPYCKFCYSKLFGPTGHRQGTSSITLDKTVTKLETTASPPKAAGAAGTVEAVDNSKATNPFLQRDKETRASTGKAPAPAPPRPVAKPAASAAASGGGAPKCAACTKSVFAVEEVKALGRVYHKRCFRCSGENKDGCNRVLSKMDYVDGKGKEGLGPQPYCKSCYTKLYGPKGTNARLGSSITSENDVVTPPPSAEKEKDLAEAPQAQSEPEIALANTVEAVSLNDATASDADGTADKVQLDDAISNTVFNATAKGVGPSSSAASAPARRASTLKIGGNLKYDVNKERSYEGDGDEVGDNEWE